MRTSEKWVYIILGIIVGGILAGGVVFAVLNGNNKTNPETTNTNKDKENKDEKQDNEDKQDTSVQVNDGVKLKEVKEDGNKITETFEVILNGKKKDINIVFGCLDNGEYYNITGTYNGIIDFYIDSENKEDSKFEDIYNVEKIKTYFTEDNFKVIEGEDKKNYLIIIKSVPSHDNGDNYAYVFNDELDLISKDSIKDDYMYFDKMIKVKSYFSLEDSHQPMDTVRQVESVDGPWYETSGHANDINIKHKVFKIKDNKIYYLAWIRNEDSTTWEKDGYGTLEERVYTIKNDKLEYNVINTYKATMVGNIS